MPAEPESKQRLLATAGVSVHYGGVRANDEITLAVDAGEIVGLIGPNGAGKTTFVDAITGFTRYTGTVELGGTSLDDAGPHRRRRAGLARTWQAGELFGDLTVAENLIVAVEGGGVRGALTDVFGRRRRTDQAVWNALELVGLSELAEHRPDQLTLGQQKLVGVARAIVGATQILLLDEPAAGLDTEESVAFGGELRRLSASGLGVLLIDHDMTLVLDVCDRVYVMDFGRIIATGTPAEVSADERVVAAYLGSAVTS
ncbi:ABC-type branched-chain amino acid transport system, ATPase component [Parafrankia irregularis]|uniref:ABC-type branched-chain amino acid transport system, ATPase component n=1 Tax=Parafrankia irregularis TaxID=795642 RepID=A0A0S4QR17_9ACTN|nr:MULTISPECIES: ABC transporter ATP-binding protein [Parafrankia]MBE3199900.1 ABC transporter ATP-binding protein [Parafrankia sp. CH37]CUU58055.1 ABC-type branched-chain amino acid transport system, ATPase component [Parafrankia irregularis]